MPVRQVTRIRLRVSIRTIAPLESVSQTKPTQTNLRAEQEESLSLKEELTANEGN